MTSRRTWPKADLLQQRRLALGLPLQPAPAPPLLSLVIKGGIGALVLVLLALLGLQHRQQQLQAEIDVLHPVEKRVGDAKARLRAMSSRRSTLNQQTQLLCGLRCVSLHAPDRHRPACSSGTIRLQEARSNRAPGLRAGLRAALSATATVGLAWAVGHAGDVIAL